MLFCKVFCFTYKYNSIIEVTTSDICYWNNFKLIILHPSVNLVNTNKVDKRTDRRKDFLHKVTRQCTKFHCILCVRVIRNIDDFLNLFLLKLCYCIVMSKESFTCTEITTSINDWDIIKQRINKADLFRVASRNWLSV